MRRFIAIIFCCLSSQVSLKAQNSQTRIKICSIDSTFLISGNDSSAIFNAYVLTELLNGVTGVTLTCQNLYQDTVWNTANDTSYVWSQVISDSLTASPFNATRTNENIICICLGRLYYGVRQKFIFVVDGTNGLLTREFIF